MAVLDDMELSYENGYESGESHERKRILGIIQKYNQEGKVAAYFADMLQEIGTE